MAPKQGKNGVVEQADGASGPETEPAIAAVSVWVPHLGRTVEIPIWPGELEDRPIEVVLVDRVLRAWEIATTGATEVPTINEESFLRP